MKIVENTPVCIGVPLQDLGVEYGTVLRLVNSANPGEPTRYHLRVDYYQVVNLSSGGLWRPDTDKLFVVVEAELHIK